MRTAEALGLTIALTCGGLMVIIKTVTHDSEIAALRARVSALEAEQRILRRRVAGRLARAGFRLGAAAQSATLTV